MRAVQIAAAGLGLALLPVHVWAEEQTNAGPGKGWGWGPEHRKEMMARHEEMAKKLKDSDARLQDLVEKMNKAEGADKTAAMVAVINELAKEHREFTEHVLSMHERWAKDQGEKQAEPSVTPKNK